MAQKWSDKFNKQYEEIKSSLTDKGKDAEQAKEIAARTVNKLRRKANRTVNSVTKGTGNPNEKFEERTKDEVYNVAKKMDISGRSKMNKSELISAIRSMR